VKWEVKIEYCGNVGCGLGVEGEDEGRAPASTFMKMTKYRRMESSVKEYGE
jgi:hypothetical protein